jgi:RNA polymerase sigma factor (sigma-70 family)
MMILSLRSRRDDLQTAFLVMLPSIQRYGAIAFRHLRGDAQDDAIQEIIANAFVAFARLVEQGRPDRAFPTVLARYAIAQVCEGRKVGTSQNRRDVLSKDAQRKGRYAIERLDRFDRHAGDWSEAVVEDRRTSVPDQAAFRIDFPNWLNQLSPRHRKVAELLINGYSTSETAHQAGVSPGRISQLRRELHADWHRFHGEEPPLVTRRLGVVNSGGKG